jgi:hypothetical protein
MEPLAVSGLTQLHNLDITTLNNQPRYSGGSQDRQIGTSVDRGWKIGSRRGRSRTAGVYRGLEAGYTRSTTIEVVVEIGRYSLFYLRNSQNLLWP